MCAIALFARLAFAGGPQTIMSDRLRLICDKRACLEFLQALSGR